MRCNGFALIRSDAIGLDEMRSDLMDLNVMRSDVIGVGYAGCGCIWVLIRSKVIVLGVGDRSWME